jgi:hypothetical protein
MMDTPFANGYKYYCHPRLEFVNSCQCSLCPAFHASIETQEKLITLLLTSGRDPAVAWFALSGKDPLPGSDCAASPDQIRSVMAYAETGKQPEYVAVKTGLPVSLVLNVFRVFGIPHKAPGGKETPERHNRPAARRAR